MFEISREENDHVLLSGRLDASQVAKLKSVLDTVTQSCVVDFKTLEYISSAGLGVLLATQKRLRDSGYGLKLVNLNKHIRNIFAVAGFDFIFDIE
ncbi:MAG: STAS domain-containing protein [Candidatus Eiseniibacteriota bacterium]|nr:MAG: STAS domain-containing protein [Candidatus Eisenbacteria bacterium]